MVSGHWVLAGGEHSEVYFDKMQLLSDPDLLETAVDQIWWKIQDAFGPWLDVDVFAGPTTGGAIVAYSLASMLYKKVAYIERVKEGSSIRENRRGYLIQPGDNVIILDDVLTTGRSLMETYRAVVEKGGNVRCAAVLMNRSNNDVDYPFPLFSLWQDNIYTWTPDNCPMCADGVYPAVKPGTTTELPGHTQ